MFSSQNPSNKYSSSDEDGPVKEKHPDLVENSDKLQGTINGFVGEVEVMMKIDASQRNSFLSEEAWRKYGNDPTHLKPVKPSNYTYNREQLSVIGDHSFGYCRK